MFAWTLALASRGWRGCAGGERAMRLDVGMASSGTESPAPWQDDRGGGDASRGIGRPLPESPNPFQIFSEAPIGGRRSFRHVLKQLFALSPAPGESDDSMLPLVALLAPTAPPLTPNITIAPGVSMPRINLGTCCGSEATHSFPSWYAAGGRGVDTALDYGKEVPGGTEAELRAAIDKTGARRENLFITTKVRAGLDPLHLGRLCIGLDADYALKAVRADLAQLKVSQVDLVLLHAPCKSDATNAKLWQGMEQALALNLTRAIGVSNFGKAALGALLSAATVKPAVNQCQMSMADQEDEMLSFCAEHGIVFEAYAAMRGCPFGDAQVRRIAAAHGVGVSQVCLRWVLQKGAAMAVGLGDNATLMPEYAKADLDVYGFALSDAEMATLSSTGKQISSCQQGY
jgi:2,5-diketo-D-gluconate reductase A